MNNLIQIREKQKKAERLHQAQLLAEVNGNLCSYSRSNFVDRQRQAREDFSESV